MNNDNKLKVNSAIADTVEKILDETSWTGRDLGYLAIANAAVKFQQALENKETIDPLIDSKKLQDMVDTLSGNDYEIKIYQNYTLMYSWILKRCQTAGLMMIKAKKECQYLYSILFQSIIIENAIKCAEKSQEIATNIQKSLLEYSIDSTNDKILNDIIASKTNFCKELYYVNGINTLIDMIAKAYKMLPFSLFRVPTEDIRKQTLELKDAVATLKDNISKSKYLSIEKINQKIDLINNHFGNINFNDLFLQKDIKEKVYKAVKDFNVFVSRQETLNIISLVCDLPKH